jgi:endonuclease III
LTAWHDNCAEQDPAWRANGATPWTALLGELVLARTPRPAADTIFKRLIEVAATPAGTAGRSREELAATGLSANAAGRVLAVAREVVSLFDGDIPSEDIELQLLPGVGDGVSGAVRGFGHNRSAILLDTATSRIAERVYGRGERRRWQLRMDLHRLSAPAGPDPRFNRALVMLASQLCRPVHPRCSECPLGGICAFPVGAPLEAR